MSNFSTNSIFTNTPYRKAIPLHDDLILQLTKQCKFESNLTNYEEYSEYYPKHSTSISILFWIEKKVIAIPAAAYTGIIKTTCHLAQFILSFPYRIFTHQGALSLTASFFCIIRDIQESFGWITTFFYLQRGQFYIHQAQFHKECYKKFDQQRSVAVDSVTIDFDHLSNRQFIQILSSNNCDHDFLAHLSIRDIRNILAHKQLDKISYRVYQHLPSRFMGEVNYSTIHTENLNTLLASHISNNGKIKEKKHLQKEDWEQIIHKLNAVQGYYDDDFSFNTKKAILRSIDDPDLLNLINYKTFPYAIYNSDMNEKQFRSLNAKNFTTILQESLIPDNCHTRNGWKMVASWINKFDFKNRILWNQLTISELRTFFTTKSDNLSYRLGSLPKRFATLNAEHFQQIFHLLAEENEGYFNYVPPKYINIAVSSFDTVASSKLCYLLSTHINEKLHFLTKESFKKLIDRHLWTKKSTYNNFWFVNHEKLFKSIPIDKIRDLPWEALDSNTIRNIIFPKNYSSLFDVVYFSPEIQDKFAQLTGEDVFKIFSKLSSEQIMNLISEEQLSSYRPLNDLYRARKEKGRNRDKNSSRNGQKNFFHRFAFFKNSTGPSPSRFSSGTRNDRESSSRSSNPPMPEPTSGRSSIKLPQDVSDFITAVNRTTNRNRDLVQWYKKLTKVYHPDKIQKQLRSHFVTLYADQIKRTEITLEQIDEAVQESLSDSSAIYTKINTVWDKLR